MGKQRSTTAKEAANIPETEVVPRAQRRRFTAAYKLRILDEADACVAPGALGALLRKEGLYSSHLLRWRKQRDSGSLYGSTAVGKELAGAKAEIRQLRMALEQAQLQVKRAETFIEVQKKSHGCLGWTALQPTIFRECHD